jgi:hypothetical protein
MDSELDQAAVFQDLITELTRKGESDPVLKAVNQLERHRRLNVLRKLELAVTEEVQQMEEKERETFLKSMHGPPLWVCVNYRNEPDIVFSNFEDATKALHKWFTSNKLCGVLVKENYVLDFNTKSGATTPTLEDCREMIMNGVTVLSEYRARLFQFQKRNFATNMDEFKIVAPQKEGMYTFSHRDHGPYTNINGLRVFTGAVPTNANFVLTDNTNQINGTKTFTNFHLPYNVNTTITNPHTID